MSIGVITMKEAYWSLNEFSTSAVSALAQKYSIIHLMLDGKKNETEKIRQLYKKNEIVINLSSKSLSFDRGNNTPTIFFGHAWMDHGAGINLYVNGRYLLSSDIMTFASKAALEKFRAIYKSRIKSCVLPYFSTIKTDSSANETLIRRQYRIPSGKKIVLYFGRLCQEKNIDVLIDVFNQIKNDDCCLVLVGSFSNLSTFGFISPPISKYRKIIQNILSKKESSNIFFVENVERSELLNLISVSYISVNLSVCYEEDFGVSAVESMMAGLPVVCSRWGGLKDIVAHAGSGYLVDVKFKNTGQPNIDFDQAKKYLSILLRSQKTRDRFSRNSIARAKKYFSSEAFIKNIGGVINRVSLRSRHSRHKSSVLVPRPIFLAAYKKSLAKNSVDTIYRDNPKIYKSLYSIYCGHK